MSIILDGLTRLEYRGYDSAGFAVLSSGEIVVRRSAGKLANLANIAKENPAFGSIGIGHTRWATHGAPNETNAHPHRDCNDEVVIIHNGIVENYTALKKGLLERGHAFRSQTDSEIIAHLIEEGLQAGAAPVDAIREALTQLRGAHAIVVLTTREPGRIYAARIGNAGGVCIGQGDGEMFVASDMPAILSHTRRLVFLDSHELAVVQKDGASYFRLDGELVEKTPQTVNWDPISAAKGGYKHFMLKEIHEQPRSLSDTLSGRLGYQPPAVYLEDFGMTDEELRSRKKVIIVSCGTAWHASLVGKFLIEGLARLPVEVDYASEFRYRDSLVDPTTLVVAVTQSGETVDTLVSMERAKAVGAGLVGIVNVVGSQATRVADGVIYTRSGPEIGVASTKAFTGQLMALYLLALRLGQAHGTISGEQMAQLI
ncbi:MAG TPA: glutamine--fructose-6-phosphate transaminase (isomerizing), partial [Chloroflexota bacterium]|nr:glutamine--fructose-6-phosphate transaminase (isomerizing) [Chloroflexota bacterium]